MCAIGHHHQDQNYTNGHELDGDPLDTVICPPSTQLADWTVNRAQCNTTEWTRSYNRRLINYHPVTFNRTEILKLKRINHFFNPQRIAPSLESVSRIIYYKLHPDTDYKLLSNTQTLPK